MKFNENMDGLIEYKPNGNPWMRGYAIYLSTDGTNFNFIMTWTPNVSSFIAAPLLAGTTYTWQVYAVTGGSKAFISDVKTAPSDTRSGSIGLGGLNR